MTAVPTGSGAVGRNEKQTGGERFKNQATTKIKIV